MKDPKSKCCKADMTVYEADEGTNFYVCTKCQSPTDAEPPKCKKCWAGIHAPECHYKPASHVCEKGCFNFVYSKKMTLVKLPRPKKCAKCKKPITHYPYTHSAVRNGESLKGSFHTECFEEILECEHKNVAEAESDNGGIVKICKICLEEL